MSGLIDFTQYQAEALIICLFASVIWAGVLFLGARGLERWGSMSSAEKLWVGALLFAVLPSLAAPTLAAFGVSLRPAPEPVVLETIKSYAVAIAPMTSAAPSGPRIEPIDFDKIVGAAAIIYVYGVFLAFLLWAAKHVGLYYAISRAEPVEDRRFLARIDDWAERLDVRTPAIRRSRHVSSVCIFGVVRQTILIPHGIDARVSSEDLVLMCAHELAHVRRGDTRLFTATQLARVLFWFNPLVSRIAAHAELAAEESADALVLAKGVDRRAYAAVFVEGLKFAASRMNAHPALAPSFTPVDRHGRRRRLHSILSTEAPRKAPLATRLMVSAAASTVALAAFGQAAIAVDPESAGARRNALHDMPIIGELTQGFGDNSALQGKVGPAHGGLDIKAAKGTKVFAPGDGVVIEATNLYKVSPAWGKVVVVDHGHGLVTRYAHLDSYRVKRGDRVQTGDVIATVGATGKVTGPHLHFETLRDGEAVDPASVIVAAPAEPQDAPESAIAPEPAEAPDDRVEPAVAPEPADAPSPVVAPSQFPVLRAAPRASAFPGFKIINPVTVARAPIIRADGFHFAEPSGYAFADADDVPDRMIEDMEQRLLGASDEENGAVYDLTMRSGDKVYRFSSEEPMTAEKRAELREALREMKRERAEALRGSERARREALAAQNEWRREAERARRDLEKNAYALAWSKEDQKKFQEEFQLARQQLEIQREALEDAEADIESGTEESFTDALADLDDAEADLGDADMQAAEFGAARARIEEARRRVERNHALHERAIEQMRAGLEAQRAAIERQIEALDERETAPD